MGKKIAVVGFGVIGATTAIKLLEEGFTDVTVICKDPALATNSDSAVATWYAPDDTKPNIQALCYNTLPYFITLAKTPGSGVFFIPMAYYFKDQHEYHESGLHHAIEKGLIETITHGYTPPISKDYPVVVIASIPLANAPIYRRYLLERFQTLGGKFVKQNVTSLQTLSQQYDIIINCTGWETKRLARDEKVFPARGQIEVAKFHSPTKPPLSINISKGMYIVFRPGSQDCVLGATHQINNTSLKPDPADTDTLKSELAPFFPPAATMKTQSVVGIRCGRHDVRIDEQLIPRGDKNPSLLIHCYGHGGSGFSGSWGSAESVFDYCLRYIQTPFFSHGLTAKL